MAEPRRFLALHLPRFAADRLVRRDPDLADAPLALWAQQGQRRFVTAVNERAAASGLAAGTPLADALAAFPGLVVRPADPVGDEATLRALAAWATGFTPLAAPDRPDALILDITGCAHLHGGEPGLLDAAAKRLRAAGFAVRAAIADTAVGAAVLARGSPRDIIVPPGRQAAAVAPLPVAALRPDPETAESCARLGLDSIGALGQVARGPLARRLGPDLLAKLDEATGRTLRPITPIRPPPPARAMLECPESILTAEAIGEGLRRLLARLCADLAERGLGARRLTLACFRTDGTVQRIGIGTGTASRDAAHLGGLLGPRIERIDPGFGIERMVLSADAVEPLAARQGGLPGSDAETADRQEAIGRLIDRLRGRLGANAVRRLDPHPSHWPEEAVKPVDPATPPRPGPWPTRPRPVRLAARPRPIAALCPLPDGPPARLGSERVLRAEGPERILPAWWRPAAAQAGRDYWRIETEGGRRLWVFAERDGAAPAWFLHGWFG